LAPLTPWGDLRPLLSGADSPIVNLECVVASSGRPWSRWSKTFHFRADPIATVALQAAGVDCVTLANNHVLDYEEAALLEMFDLLQQGGIAFAGAGRDLAEACRPAILDAHGLRVGVIAFTDNEPDWCAERNLPGTNYIPITLDERALGPVRQTIDFARAGGANLVVFTIHWGPNMVRRPSPLFRRFARAVIDAGADVFFGHSAHIFQGIELYQGCPIIYDAGDFVDDHVVDPELRNDWGSLLYVHVDHHGIRRVEPIPSVISDRQANCARASEFQEIAERLEGLSAEFGTSILREGNRLWIEVRPPLLLKNTAKPVAANVVKRDAR
jgi:poly-gamma-glutamate capsule biosynthesis protein CapA/YwtB (metallophosphatase superfamily)